jgi:hypothetical protein
MLSRASISTRIGALKKRFNWEVEMADVSGATLVGRSLKNEGVKAIFTLCGGPSLISIYNTCVDEGIELIDMRHEQAVANAATGYALATQEPSVAMVTSGPGVVNMASGCRLGRGRPGYRYLRSYTALLRGKRVCAGIRLE